VAVGYVLRKHGVGLETRECALLECNVTFSTRIKHKKYCCAKHSKRGGERERLDLRVELKPCRYVTCEMQVASVGASAGARKFCCSAHSGTHDSRTRSGFYERLLGRTGCSVCGWWGAGVDVHHIVPRHKGGGDEPENLIRLCANHHRLIHMNLARVVDGEYEDLREEVRAMELLKREDWAREPRPQEPPEEGVAGQERICALMECEVVFTAKRKNHFYCCRPHTKKAINRGQTRARRMPCRLAECGRFIINAASDGAKREHKRFCSKEHANRHYNRMQIDFYEKLVEQTTCSICAWWGPGLDEHHVVPVSEGGSGEPDNLVLLCANHHKLVHSDLARYEDGVYVDLREEVRAAEIEKREIWNDQ